MNFSDRKTQLIAGGIALAAVVIILAVVLLGGKKKGGQAGAGAGAGGGQWSQGQGGQGQGGQGQWGGQGGTQQAANQGGAAPVPGQTTPGGGAAGGPVGKPFAPGAALMVGSGENSATSRPDPLLLLQAPPPAIQAEQLVQLPPVTLEQGGIRRQVPQVAADNTVANRRVAGVKFNGGAWAILVSDTDSFVVKPGDVIDGTKIDAISREAIYVTDPQGQKWIVPLRGAGPGGATPVGGAG